MAKKLFCPSCGHTGKPKVMTKGSILIEIILWICFIVPGLIYTLWRQTSGKYTACPKCGNTSMIPPDSPMAQKMLAGAD